jgi:hypothetical protein
MADPVIVPPPPTITQPSTPGDDSPGFEQVQRAFDRAYPDTSAKEAPPSAPTAAPATPPPPEIPPKAPEPPKEEHKIPSFLEEALKPEPSQPKPAPTAEPDEEWPEELPQEERKSRIKGLRDAYKSLKEEVKSLKAIPQRDPQEQQRLEYLQNQNKQMAEALSRFGVEQSAQFQQQIMQPLYASWNEAARIVHEAGGDPNELAKAMSLSGKSQFEALDTLFSELPESAKMEAHDALRSYRRFEDARRAAVADAPRTMESIRQQETQRQYQELSKQREDMKSMFDRALLRLRDEAKVEVFQKTNDPEGKWWNDQAEMLTQQGRDLFLENTDLDRVALACLLAPAADAYRKLFLTSQKKVSELQKIIKDRFGNEPNLSESSGNAGDLTPESQIKDDLKKPFNQVFLREFHKAQARNR